jgi:diguanylate cyclase (GGDEF)-like protein
VAEALQATLRENDFLARYGGEELVLVLEGLTGESVRPVLERYRNRVVECGIPHELNDGFGCVTASFGAALHGPGCRRGPQEMIQRADQALYRAKSAGRNCVVIDPEVRPGAAAA